VGANWKEFLANFWGLFLALVILLGMIPQPIKDHMVASDISWYKGAFLV
jgi:hypothetical protein